MHCAIFLNGEYHDDEFARRRFAAAELVIAADGGYAVLDRLGLVPQVLVGDFDSLDPELLQKAREAGVEVFQHPVAKERTDAELAIVEGERRGARTYELLGALGGDFDHLMGHVGVLRSLASRGRPARIADPGMAARVFWSPAELRLTAPVGTRVSLMALSPAAVVTLRGLEYELTNVPLRADRCVGLSNTVTAEGARIELFSGVLLVMVYDGGEMFAGRRPGRR